ncbi:rhodanese-like domain-containing protein [Ectothiorhodospira lacustris]|uniref:rhodanese-like domain-containing protein n=1 Tax=Ectothiorhodospira lacustris TaxID=2899127 RepID=UPI001EE8888C|nr:rhodanese-like domain-containing protein [Ectothiorhodospira lacustris]MCG5501616.1 hypothetical protein [Ectothiorhodospira lacustris]
MDISNESFPPIFGTASHDGPREVDCVELEQLLKSARDRGNSSGRCYSGDLRPGEAWYLCDKGLALLVDVRTEEEVKFVGCIPRSHHIPWENMAWRHGGDLVRNPYFMRDLEKVADRETLLLFICRSGRRSAAAAEAVAKAGYRNVFNVSEGFEGDLDDDGHRGLGGWRYWGLPWTQD